MFSNEEYLTELLVEAGLVSTDEVAAAREKISIGESIIEQILAQTALTQEQIAQTLAANAAIGFVRLSEINFHPGITETISEETARRYRVIPVEDDGLTLTVAVADPLDFEVL
ncbi:MAG: hypothetical protein RIR37_1231, partial [Verrucomicrobiota bacterium]